MTVLVNIVLRRMTRAYFAGQSKMQYGCRDLLKNGFS